MPKSIHERVREALAKKEREEKRAADKARDIAERRAGRPDEAYERGVQWALEGHMHPPRGAGKDFRLGFMAGVESETRDMLGE